MKLKQQIPKHIYNRGTAGLGEPDFYIGPTIAEKEFTHGSQQASRQDDDLKTEMKEMREEAAREIANRPSFISQLVGLVRGRASNPQHTTR